MPNDDTQIGYNAVAELYHAYVTGLLLTVVTRRGERAAEDFWFGVFRRQHTELFLAGVEKLGLGNLPDAVKAAQYHYLSNRVGGVDVEYMYESDRKAWVRFPPPRWIYDGTAICGIPSGVSRALLRGWYGHNGVSLGNPRLGFVCTAQTMDAQSGLTGYFLEYDRELGPDERLRFSPGEEPPPFDPTAAPGFSPADWPEDRLRKAHRNYAMNFTKTSLLTLADTLGPAEARYLGHVAGRLIGMQIAKTRTAGIRGQGTPKEFADYMATMARAQDDPVDIEADGDAVLIRQSGWRLMRGAENLHPCVFDGWNGLWEGALLSHNRLLVLEVLRRIDYGDDCFTWRVRAKN